MQSRTVCSMRFTRRVWCLSGGVAFAMMALPAAHAAYGDRDVHSAPVSAQVAMQLSRPALVMPATAPSSQALRQYFDEAERCYGKRDDVTALRIFSSLVELAPDYRQQSWFRLGNIHQRMGSVGQALDAYRHLLPTGSDGDLATPAHPDSRPALRSFGTDRNAAGMRRKTDTLDVHKKAVALKGMVNLIMLSMQQTQSAMDYLSALLSDPSVAQAAGFGEAEKGALWSGIHSQLRELQRVSSHATARVAVADRTRSTLTSALNADASGQNVPRSVAATLPDHSVMPSGHFSSTRRPKIEYLANAPGGVKKSVEIR